MAGSSQARANRRRARVAPNGDHPSTRVSRAVGSVPHVKNQDSIASASRRRDPIYRVRGIPSHGFHQEQSRSSLQSSPRSLAATAKMPSRPRQRMAVPEKDLVPARTPNSPPRSADSRDVRAIRWLQEKWKSLQPHHQQQIFSIALLCLSLLLFASMTIFSSQPICQAISHLFLDFFGWSAYLLAIGLVAFAITHLLEGIYNRQILRWPFVIGLMILWLLLLLESRLIFGAHVGFLAELLAILFLGWPPIIGHSIVLSLIIITSIFTFHIHFHHLQMFINKMQNFWIAASQIARTKREDPHSTNSQESLHLGKADKKVSSSEMEPLLPNPRLGNSQKRSPKREDAPVKKGKQVTWQVPGPAILDNADMIKGQMQNEEIASLAENIQETLRCFHVAAEVRAEDISIGPTIIRFGIRPTGKPAMRRDEKTKKMMPVLDESGQIVYETRTRVSRILALQSDLALVLEAKTIRMEAPVPGRPYVGVEIPNKQSRLVTLREVLESKEYQAQSAKSNLTIGLGRDVTGLVRVGDLARMPHLLIAGATGSGKSVAINTIIASILMQATPDDVRFLMIDPKMVELSIYNGIPHLLAPVVTDVEQVVPSLQRAINEMEQRYRRFSQLGVRNLDAYRKLRQQKLAQNDPSYEHLPSIVIIIDELADLMMAAADDIESMICRLAQLARATGIHLVVATQRPSVDVVTGLIKANFPTRISFMVSSAVDSRTIIDMGGAERLLGHGDMLYLPADAGRPERIQGAFLSDDEAKRLADHWRQQRGSRGSA